MHLYGDGEAHDRRDQLPKRVTSPSLLLEGDDFIEFSAIAVSPDGRHGLGVQLRRGAYTLDLVGVEVVVETPRSKLAMEIYAADFDSSGQPRRSRWPQPADPGRPRDWQQRGP